jgi:polyisoprenyl-phosphate glycosyltransferase
MIKYSIILPCFNESENISILLEKFNQFAPQQENIEVIIVNNGSTDNTEELKQEIINKYSFTKWCKIDINKGYGYGIYSGLLQAKGKYIGYTHADLQTDPLDIKKAIDKIENQEKEYVFVKGMRKGRSFVSKLFSKGLETSSSLILSGKFKEINAQPTIFHRDLMKQVSSPPNHWGLDMYLYYKAMQTNYMFIRFDVVFPKRLYGNSKWAIGIFSRLKLAFQFINYCFFLRKEKTGK